MRRSVILGLSAAVMLGVIAACARQASRSERASTASAEAAAIPSGSRLGSVELGMTKREVEKILGEPDDENSYMTGKAFIPFYFGNDTRRTAWYYKGLGRVIFADGNVFGGGGNEVVRVDYDPSESGVAR